MSTNLGPIRPAKREAKTIEPTRPSYDFLGEIFGAIRCLPIKIHVKYPQVSLSAVIAINKKTRPAPSSGLSINIAKEPNIPR